MGVVEHPNIGAFNLFYLSGCSHHPQHCYFQYFPFFFFYSFIILFL